MTWKWTAAKAFAKYRVVRDGKPFIESKVSGLKF
jgi:hypothetical protein